MERIVIEVSPNVAKAWRKMPEKEKKEVGNEVSMRIAKKAFKESREEFLAFIDDLQQRMKERGLTQEKLDEILNDEA
jgi:mRNA-degrading endonuclease RelE of RelBE toxin-antitoxin system